MDDPQPAPTLRATSGLDERVRVTVVGSGTMLPDHRRRSAAHYLEGAGARLLMDCGPGTLHSLEEFGVPWAGLTHLALTHFHTDHTGDLPGLFFALKNGPHTPRAAPLTVLGPRGLEERFRHLAAAFGDQFLDPGFDLSLVELVGGERWKPAGGAFTLACHPTPHTEASLAYRWEGDGVTVGYTGDTAPSDEVAAFLAGCDLVISECAFADPAPEGGMHLSPSSLAEMARSMDPGLLLLTHVYPGQTPDEAARAVHDRGWPGRVAAARDGTVVRLGGGRPALDHPGTPG